MKATPETQALLEKALEEVFKQQKLVLSKGKMELMETAKRLGDLASDTWEVLKQGLHKIKPPSNLTKEARLIEKQVDEISKAIWCWVPVDISCHYQKVEESFHLSVTQEHLKHGMAISVRNHYHNLRIMLLEQLLGARMLINNNDYGSESERLWQQFFEQQLGPHFRVLLGGHIFDYEGNNADAQIDLIIVAADAQVITPGNSDGGKVHILCDQVIAAVMVTSNLTVAKFKDDWPKLERISKLFDPTKDIPHLKGQSWPLCYMVAGQSDSIEDLSKAWASICGRSTISPNFAPDVILALDSGYAYSGTSAWPFPPFAKNEPNAWSVRAEDGIYSGLGIAWILTQIRARAKLVNFRPLADIEKFAKLLWDANLRPLPASVWSRFRDSRKNEIAGKLEWGGIGTCVYNHLTPYCLLRRNADGKITLESYVYRKGVEISKLNSGKGYSHTEWLRYFDRSQLTIGGNLAVFTEWTRIEKGPEWKQSYTILDVNTAEEIDAMDSLTGIPVSDWPQALKAISDQRESLGGA